MRFVSTLLVGALLLPAAAFAHEGHDDAEPEAVEVKNISPRAEASSDLFEMLVVADGGQMVIYLDRFIGNEPVSGAEIEILADEEFEPVVEYAPGVYVVPWQPVPGDYELTIAVLAGDLDDLLILTIGIPEELAASAVGSGGLGNEWLWAVIVILLGIIAAMVLASPARRRRVVEVAAAIPGASRLRARNRSVRPDASTSPPTKATPAE
jgi:hypothetical protein